MDADVHVTEDHPDVADEVDAAPPDVEFRPGLRMPVIRPGPPGHELVRGGGDRSSDVLEGAVDVGEVTDGPPPGLIALLVEGT